MDLIGASHPFYKSATRRYVIVAVCLGWSAIEWLFGDPFWAVIATGVLGFAAYELIWTYDARYGPNSKAVDNPPDAKP